MDKPFWLRAEKLRPNVPLDRLMRREGVLGALQDSTEQVILVQAPAGYGKTSVLAYWYDTILRSGLKPAWLSLDEKDADPATFICHLVAAIRSANCLIEYELPHHPQVLSQQPPDALFGSVVKTLSRKSYPDFIFLDDFHLAENPQICSIIWLILEEMPESRVVLSSRSVPSALRLSELRNQHRCCEITRKDLQFTMDEMRCYLGDLLEDAGDGSICDEVATKTEGWPISLQAIRALVRDGVGIQDAISKASGRSSVLSDYFLERVFNSLTDQQQHLLLHTAFLQRVNGDLANAVCGTSTSWALLEELERNDVFVTSLDAERQWYRYHGLFAEFLAERARRRPGFSLKEIHCRASDWCLKYGTEAEALHYALLSEDFNQVAQTLEILGGWRQAVVGDIASVVKALRMLPEDILRRHPKVWLADIYINLKEGEWARARAAYEEFVSLHQEASNDSAFAIELKIFDGLMLAYFDHVGKVPEAISLLDELGFALRRDDHFLQATRFSLLAGLHVITGDFDAVIRDGDASIQHFRKLNALYAEVFVYYHQAQALYESGRLRDALATLGQGLDLAESHYGEGSELFAIGAAFAAHFAYQMNDLSQARRFLDIALPTIEQCDAWAEVYIVAYGTELAVAAKEGDRNQVELIRRRAEHVTTERQLLRVAEFVDDTIFELRLQKGIKQASSTPERNVRGCSEQGFSLVDLPLICSKGRQLLSKGEHEAAIAHFHKYACLARRRKMVRAFLKLTLLEAIANREAGAADQATALFETVLSLALFENFKRIIIDEGQAVAQLIKDTFSAPTRAGTYRLRDRFLAELIVEIEAGLASQESPETVLTPRETEIMRSVLSGRSNREVAEVLDISQNTVKFHLKNIFQKLNVSTRSEAINVCLRESVI